MRITFVKDGLGLSGGDRVIAIHADRLARRGHDVTVVARPNRPRTLRQRLATLVRHGKWLPARQTPPAHTDGSAASVRRLDSHRPVAASDVPDGDVVIATWWETAEWVDALPASKGAKAFFLQHYEVFSNTPADRVDAAWRMPLHKIVISRWLADLARDRFGDDSATLVPNSVDTVQFHAPARGKQPVPTIGFMHHSAAWKGVSVALDAIRRVAMQFPKIRVVSFGEPAFTESWPENVEHRHYQRPAQDFIRDVYASADAWLSSSVSEGFSLPALEAMACRCPVVATRSGGPVDFVEDGVNGYLAPVNDADALSRRLVEILRLSDEEWRRMSDAALVTATRYSWDDATDLFEAALQQIVTGNMGVAR